MVYFLEVTGFSLFVLMGISVLTKAFIRWRMRKVEKKIKGLKKGDGEWWF